jgi:2-amino-4-hydroxy-6-hydroxymethyldihydropteridine diphosphokinase
MNAFIGLGSNLGDGVAFIKQSLAVLDQHDSIEVLRKSTFYRTAAWGNTEQPDFTNSVAEIKTTMTPSELLQVLLETEKQLGRVRAPIQWGPRHIDIDLLCCNERVLHTPELELPHPRMHLRAFVLVPLLELQPNIVIPGRGSARSCLENLEDQTIEQIL